MATKYCYSGATGSANGSSWANAYTTITLAIVGMAAGDTLFIADDHSESTAGAVTLLSPGTSSNFCNFICALRVGGSVPPVSADLRTTAVVATTSTNAINIQGVGYWYGIQFKDGSGNSNDTMAIANANSSVVIAENCLFAIVGTGTGGRITLGTAGTVGTYDLNNCTFSFANASQAITLNNLGSIRGGSLAGTTPTVLFFSVSREPIISIRGMDLSSMGSGKTLINSAAGTPGYVCFDRCKLGASVTKVGAPIIQNFVVDFIACDSSGVSDTWERYCYQGTETTETTVICTAPSSGGAGPTDNITPFSRKIVTTSNNTAPYAAPFECFDWPELYIGATGSPVSITVETMTDGVTLTNSDFRVEVEYMGTAGSPVGSVASSGPADPLASASNLSASTATWVTTGITTPTAQKVTVSFTPQIKGVYRLVPKVGKASQTLWLSPPALKAA